MVIKKKIVAGDSAIFTVPKFGAFAPDAATCTVLLRGPDSKSIAAVAEADGWASELTAEESADLAEGLYTLFYRYESGSAKKTVRIGTVMVEPNPDEAADFDGRSLARKALDDALAALADFMKDGGKAKSYTIGTRSITYRDISEIKDAIAFWRGIVRQEEIAELGYDPYLKYARFTQWR